MKIKDIITMLEVDIEFSKRDVFTELELLKSMLDRIEKKINSNVIYDVDGLQGNEYRLNDALAKYNEQIKIKKKLLKLKEEM